MIKGTDDNAIIFFLLTVSRPTSFTQFYILLRISVASFTGIMYGQTKSNRL